MLLQRVWGPDYGSEGHYLHVYVARLRKKLERDPALGRYFVSTEPWVGYRLQLPALRRPIRTDVATSSRSSL